MRITRIVVTDPNDKLLPVRDVIELADHSDVAGLIKDYAPRLVGLKVSVEFADVSYAWDTRDADVGVNGGRGW